MLEIFVVTRQNRGNYTLPDIYLSALLLNINNYCIDSFLHLWWQNGNSMILSYLIPSSAGQLIKIEVSHINYVYASLVAHMIQESAGCLGSIVFLPREPPRGCKELDMTEWLSHTHQLCGSMRYNSYREGRTYARIFVIYLLLYKKIAPYHSPSWTF